MLRSNIQMGEFIAQLKLLLKSVVVKRDKLAAAFDSDLTLKKAADKYINTIDNGDDWNSYVQFDVDVLLAAGFDKNMISFYRADKNNIPREMRAKVVALQKAYIIDNYEEMNDYYLMLNGKPPIEDTAADWLYCPENEYNIPTTVPVHKLNTEHISLMEALGILDTMIKENPTKTYLKYLGKKSIDIYTARTTPNFGILYIDTRNIDNVIREDFIKFYDKARAYYMIGYYNREYSNMFVWYDEFMGLLIITMAVQRLITNIYKQGLTRDFYDVNLIKYLFKSYSIPYIEEIDIRYQRALAKNLNYLLQYKATDKVLYDVSYLLGFYDVNIYKYYLMKTHNLDNNGHPIFAKKTRTENGKTITEYDYEKMFSFHFQQINLKEDDVNSALTDSRYKVSYETITGEDPYWIEDSDLKQKLYETDFNHMVSKYMSLDVTVKVVEMLYEVAHTIRMLIDNQKDFKRIMINIPAVSEYDVSLFDVVILLCALGARKYGLPGKIPLKGYQIANVYGFNYTENIEALKNAIYDTKDLTSGEILYAQDMKSFYEVMPGEPVKIPNQFRNTVSGTSTSEYTTVVKNNFSPIEVTTVDSLPAEGAENGKLYQITGVYDTLYMPSDHGYMPINVTVVSTLGYNLIDSGLAQYIKSMRAVEDRDVGRIYEDLKTLRTFIVKMMDDTTDKDVYYQYRKLYRALLVTEDTQELYKGSDGDVEATYASLLQSINPNLYNQYIQMIEVETTFNNVMDAIFSKLSSLGDYKYLANVNRVDNMFDSLMRLLRFFKSYTVDFIQSGIHYVLDDSYFQGLKLLDYYIISSAVKDIRHPLFYTQQWYKDVLEEKRSMLFMYDHLDLLDRGVVSGIMYYWDKYRLKLKDDIYIKYGKMHTKDDIQYYDDIELHGKNLFLPDPMKLSDLVFLNVVFDEPRYRDDHILYDRMGRDVYMYNTHDASTNKLYSVDHFEMNNTMHTPIKDQGIRLSDRVKIKVSTLG